MRSTTTKSQRLNPKTDVAEATPNRHEDRITTIEEFDDQCAGADPRYPLNADVRDMYLTAFGHPVE